MASLDRCLIQFNSAGTGVLRSSNVPPLALSNCVIANNAASGTFAVVQSGAASNCTLVNNTGPNVVGSASSSAVNCIFAGNSPIGSNVDVRYSLVPTLPAIPGVGNIVGTPQFVSLVGGGDLHLIPGSLGVDAGLSSLVPPGALDLDGRTRILDNPAVVDAGGDCPAVDMGAYETAGIVTIAPTVTLSLTPIEVDAPALIQLTAGVTGGNVTPTFRWTKGGVDLANGPSAGGGVLSGATTTALRITGAGENDSGDYALVAHASCQTVHSGTVSVLVRPACIADFNGDGLINPDDLSEFITCFFLQLQFPGFCATGDFNQDGLINPDDLSEFITVFFLTLQFGC
jgi:hypothetical protein